jgi:hypothetical protein
MSDQLRTAVHEASHAVIAALLGCAVERITLKVTSFRMFARHDQQQRLAILMAGHVGERIAGLATPDRPLWVIDWEPASKTDGGKAAQILRGIEAPLRNEIWAEVEGFVKRMLCREWATVSLLARLLEIRGELAGPELAALLPAPLALEEIYPEEANTAGTPTQGQIRRNADAVA